MCSLSVILSTRHRLGTSKAEGLVYIYTNNKLERERRGQTPARWYERYLEEEDFGQEEDEVIPEGEDDVGGLDLFLVEVTWTLC